MRVRNGFGQLVEEQHAVVGQCSGMYLDVGRYSDTLALKPDAIATPARADNTNWICVTSNQWPRASHPRGP